MSQTIISVDAAELATILAALRFYQREGQGETELFPWLSQWDMEVAGLPKQTAIKSEWTSIRISTHAGSIPRMGLAPHFLCGVNNAKLV